MILHYGIYIFLFLFGIIVAVIFTSDISLFLLWIRDSLCEKDPVDGIYRASGKSISAVVLVMLFVSISLFICRQGYIGKEDFKPNQKDLIIVIIDTIEYLLIFFYGLKLMGKAKLSAMVSALISKNSSNGSDKPADTNTNTPAPVQNAGNNQPNSNNIPQDTSAQ